MTPCAYCGEDIDQHGTELETELFIDSRGYVIRPAFCSWPHAAAWFNQAPPDIDRWQQLRKHKAPVDGGVVTWLILAALVTLLLVSVICLIVFLP